jgi:hypothetical protein
MRPSRITQVEESTVSAHASAVQDAMKDLEFRDAYAAELLTKPRLL